MRSRYLFGALALGWFVGSATPAASSDDGGQQAASTVLASKPLAAAAGEETLSHLVMLVTDRKMHPIGEMDAAKTLSEFGAVKRQQRIPETCSFSASSKPELYAALDYSKDSNGSWADPELAFYIFGSSQNAEIFKKLNRSIGERLGKPWRTKKAHGEVVAAVWNFKKPLKVWLSRTVSTAPGYAIGVDHVELTVGKATEEVDD